MPIFQAWPIPRFGMIRLNAPRMVIMNELGVEQLRASYLPLDEFQAGSPDDVTVQEQAAALHRYGGHISRALNNYSAALTAYGIAIQILQHLSATLPDEAHYRDALALTLVDRALLEKNLGRLTASAAALNRAYVVAEKSKGNIFESLDLHLL
jgi:tetratricopeptide (TPR) repeat protein